MAQHPTPPFRSLNSLKPLQLYAITKVQENPQGMLLLTLRGNEEEGTFRSFFLLPHLSRQLLRESVLRNIQRNGSNSPLYLVHTGISFFGYPLLDVGGEGFVQRLG